MKINPCCLLWILMGTVIPTFAGAQPTPLDSDSRQALRNDLDDFVEQLEQAADSDVQAVIEATEDEVLEQHIQTWEDYLSDQANNALQNQDPRAALLDLWALTAQMNEYVGTEAARVYFGDSLETVRTTTRRFHDRIRDTASAYLPTTAYQKARQSISDFVRRKPLELESAAPTEESSLKSDLFSLVDIGKNTIGAVASVPLLPQRTVQGIQRGTDEFERFNEIAAQFQTTMQNLPEETRRQMEMLLNQLAEQQPQMSQLLNDLRQSAVELNQLVQNADKLSTDVQKTIEVSEKASLQFTETARAIDAASQSTDQLIQSIQVLLDQTQTEDDATTGEGFDPVEYREAAEAIDQGAKSVHELIVEIENLIEMTRKDDRDTTPQQVTAQTEKGRGFDIRDYEATARALDDAAQSLLAILDELEQQDQEGRLESTMASLQSQIEPTVVQTTTALNRSVDHLFLRAVQLIILVFVLALVWLGVYRWSAKKRADK